MDATQDATKRHYSYYKREKRLNPNTPSLDKGVQPNMQDPNSQEALDALRHSSAHVMAQAVQELFPGTKITIGPAIEHGFYYDFDSEHRFSEDDFKAIERKMLQIVEGNHEFKGEEVTYEQSKKYWTEPRSSG